MVFTPGGAGLQLVSGLTSAPSGRSWCRCQQGLVDAALGDSGSLLTASGTTITVTNGGHASTLTTVGKLGGLAFVPGTDDAVVVDNGAKTVTLWHAVSTGGAHVVLSAPAINGAVAVGVSRDGRWALVANGGDSNLVRVDLTGGSSPMAAPCLCQPTVVEPLAGAGLFRVSDPVVVASASSPAWTVDAGAPQPRLLFIPALHASSTAEAK